MGETVVIEKAEYERLRAAAEDLADIVAYDKAKAEPGFSVPAAFVSRLIDGESPLRVFRDMRGLTQLQLSKRSGVSRVQIAEVEAGRKRGSVDTIRKLAEALDVTMDDLV